MKRDNMEQRNIISKLVNLGWGWKGVKVRAHIALPPATFPYVFTYHPHQQNFSSHIALPPSKFSPRFHILPPPAKSFMGI